MKSVSLPRHVVIKLLTLAQQEPDKETYGFIGAKNDAADTVYPIISTTKDKQRNFEISPDQKINAMKKISDNEESLFAIYHSHLRASSEPSLIDIKNASFSDVLYLIISLNTKGVLEMKGFYIEDQQAKNIDLIYS